MLNPLISVVVPVYNVELYLDKCVESIVNQTYRNLEIILVDDGSPDQCPAMCDAWCVRDSRIRVIHQSNGGLSAARNTGIRAATGELIGMIDSDDYIVPDMYEKMLSALQKSKADMCICAFRKVDENGDPIDTEDISLPNETLSREEAFGKIGKWYYVTAVNKLYKRAIFQEHLFPVGKLHEDEYTVHYFVGQCQRIVTISDELYFYFQRSTSIMGNETNVKHLDGVYALLDRYAYYKERQMRTLAKDAAYQAYGIMAIMLSCISYKKYKKELFAAFKCVFQVLMETRNLRAAKLVLFYLKTMCI